MAAIGIAKILLLLFLLGGTLGVIIAVGAAVVHGRFALAAVIGGGSVVFAFVALGLLSLFASSFRWETTTNGSAVMTKTAIESSPLAQFEFTGLPQVQVTSHYDSSPRWRIGVFPAVLLVFAIAFVLARFGKHHFAHAAAGHASAWPLLLLIFLALLITLGGLRYQLESKRSLTATGRVAAEQSAEIDGQIRAQAESLVKQQQALAKRAADMTKNIQQRIDKTDIFKLMDEFDAPRIVLQAPFATVPSPASLVISAAPSAYQSIKNSATAEVTASTNQSTEHSKSQSKRSKASKSAAAALAAAEKSEQPPVAPSSPAPPAPPTPSATAPIATAPIVTAPVAIAPVVTAPVVTAPAAAPEWLAAEGESNGEIDLHKSETMPPAGAWHVRSGAAGKPAWIKNPPKRTGDVRRDVVATEPYTTADECYRAADISLMLKAYDRLQELEGNPSPYPMSSESETLPISFRGNKIMFGGQTLWNGTNWNDYRLSRLASMGIDPDFLRREIVAKDSKNNESCEYIETVESSAGPMKKLYVQVEFTPAVDRVLSQRWDAFHRRAQFARVGLGAFSILGLLSIAWGLLKIDTATKGYYTKWLFVGVPIAIIGVAALTLFAYMQT